MITYSIVFRHGIEKFLREAKAAEFDGLIVPDLPLEEAAAFEPLATAAGLSNVMLIAPTTPAPRRAEIARHSRGFIYYMSIAGITGERDRLPDSTIAAVRELKTQTATPVCVGFGISNAATVANICQVADGAIVGSAIVRRIGEVKDKPTDQIVGHVGAFVGELLEGIR
jgi:tryptophan synthase alpha chain